MHSPWKQNDAYRAVGMPQHAQHQGSTFPSAHYPFQSAIWKWIIAGIALGLSAAALVTLKRDGAVTGIWNSNQLTAAPIEICSFPRITCLVDGDTGWEAGRKWRLLAIDTPELNGAACQNERTLAIAARDRLKAMMAHGYTVQWSGRHDRFGRALVRITLSGRGDAGTVLLREGLAQPWPNRGNIWCGR
jgi:endonuclease YncB( thermonuclease family)